MTKDKSKAFAIERPRHLLYPAVFSSPHSGCEYPQSFLACSALQPLILRTSEDCYIDTLFRGVTGLGCPLLSAKFPRAYLDVNREPFELDPAMFSDGLPSYVNASSIRVSGGLGTIPRIVAENQEIYSGKLTWADAYARISALYYPYHAALRGLINATHEAFGKVLLIDCHSMPSTAVHHTSTTSAGRADIVLGDRYGATCDNELSDYLAELFARAGLRSVRNKPYAGGYITQTYGKSCHTKQALQIEINRGLYLNERTLERSDNFSKLQQVIVAVMEEFLPSLFNTSLPGAIAAE